MFAIVLVPVAHRHARARPQASGFADRMDRPVRIGSAVILAVLVLGILLDERENVGDYLADVGLVAALFCAISLVVGYVVPKAFGVVEDQAIASSMEIGVHNATLAIFVAVEVLDSTEISVPAAVYSIFMFVFAALWGMLLTRRTASRPRADRLTGAAQPDVSAARHGRRDLAQRPAPVGDRVLLGDGQLGGRDAGLGVLVGDEQHVVAEPAAPPHLADHPAGHLARARRARCRRGGTNATAHAKCAPRRSSGTSASWASSSSLLRSVVPWAGPAQRADSTPGMPLSASTHRPLSSASDGRPVAAAPARALSRALPSKVGWSSTGSSYAGTSSRPTTSTSGACVAQDPLHLLELLGVAGGEEDPGHRRRRLASASCCRRVRSAQPFSASAEQRVELGRSNGAPSAVPCTSTKRAVAGHHDVHVGLGADVLLVGQVEPRHPVDDADADGGDRAGQRLARQRARSPRRWATASASAT